MGSRLGNNFICILWNDLFIGLWKDFIIVIADKMIIYVPEVVMLAFFFLIIMTPVTSQAYILVFIFQNLNLPTIAHNSSLRLLLPLLVLCMRSPPCSSFYSNPQTTTTIFSRRLHHQLPLRYSHRYSSADHRGSSHVYGMRSWRLRSGYDLGVFQSIFTPGLRNEEYCRRTRSCFGDVSVYHLLCLCGWSFADFSWDWSAGHQC